ncbi:Type II secretion system (T2SS), protein F [uncultured archaeon]|nr:Type II secretion system (T2SS), protein F [uncultured archaeon]
MERIIVQRRFMPLAERRGGSSLTQLLGYAGIETPPQIWLGSRLLLAMGIALFSTAVPPLMAYLLDGDIGFGAPGSFNVAYLIGFMLFSGVLAFLAVLVLMYLHLYYLIHDRVRRVEEVLPDFLLMVAAQMHAGLTPFAAFNASARPEFGPLEREIKVITARAVGTESFTDALLALADHVDSPVLRRTISFFENGLRSGGKLANLLETAAEEIRDLDELRKETVLNTKTYTIFLIFILVGGLPLLLGISTEFLGIFNKLQSQVNTDATKMMGNMLAPSLNLSAEFVGQMAVVIIVGTALFVSVFIGVISEGKVLFGLKYWPPLAIMAYLFYLGVQTMLHGFLGIFA